MGERDQLNAPSVNRSNRVGAFFAGCLAGAFFVACLAVAIVLILLFAWGDQFWTFWVWLWN
jgi:hypothetical protein